MSDPFSHDLHAMDDGAPKQIEDLIAKVASGDRAAFRQLYKQTSAKLLGVCLRILNNKAEAEDALQETFVRVWHKASTFRIGKARGFTWLAAVARNQSIDRLRARRLVEVGVDLADDLQDDTPGPEAAVVTAFEHRKIHDCLAELDDKQGRCVRLTYLNGWTYRQAADELNVPLNTVKTWIRRSLMALRACMNR